VEVLVVLVEGVDEQILPLADLADPGKVRVVFRRQALQHELAVVGLADVILEGRRQKRLGEFHLRGAPDHLHLLLGELPAIGEHVVGEFLVDAVKGIDVLRHRIAVSVLAGEGLVAALEPALTPRIGHRDLELHALAVGMQDATGHHHVHGVGGPGDDPHGAPVAGALEQVLGDVGNVVGFGPADVGLDEPLDPLLVALRDVRIEDRHADVEELVFALDTVELLRRRHVDHPQFLAHTAGQQQCAEQGGGATAQ